MRVEAGSLRRARWWARAPKLALLMVAAALAAAGLRTVLAGAPVPAAAPSATRGEQRDVAAEAFAEAFVRAYLSWDRRDPERRERDLARLASEQLDAGAGLTPPDASSQRVRQTAVAAVTRTPRGQAITVAAATGDETLHLAVAVARDHDGRLFVADYPALVGAPPTNPGAEVAAEKPLDDASLRRVARRALENYLAGERSNLLADLAPGAVQTLPMQRLKLTRVREATWALPERRVALAVEADAPELGAALTLRYELDVVRRTGRWLVRSIHTNPTPTEASP